MIKPRVNSVVVVDDSEIALEALRRVFASSSLHVRYAASAEGALSLVEAEVPSVLLSDFHMPGMDGLALIEAVKHKHPLVKCLLHTSERVDRIPTNPALVVPVMPKPCPDDVLLRMVSELAA